MRITYMWQRYKDGRFAIRRVGMDCPDVAPVMPKGGIYVRQNQAALDFMRQIGDPVFAEDPVPSEIAEVWDGKD